MSSGKNGNARSVNPASPRTNGGDLKRAVDWIVNDDMFADVRVHGNAKWTAAALVRLAIFWVWSSETSLVAAADDAVGKVKAIFGKAAVNSYQALTGALKRYTAQLLPPLWGRLHSLMEGCGDAHWRVGLWLALAVDGSRVQTPRTEKNERRFCKPPEPRRKRKRNNEKKRKRHAQRKQAAAARKKRKKKAHYDPQPVGPQMWLTLIWHIGMKLPWLWKIGPSYSSERAHVLDMLATHKFPEYTLFCGDAGFTGYDFWQEIAAHGHHFLMRVGSNVRLLRKLGWYARERDGIVYCWPDETMRKKLPPLVLRLLHFHDGRGDVYLVTNVLSERKLTAKQASQIYRRRWGVEVQFRSFKQTFQRSKLRSGTPDCAEVELHWSLVGLTALQLLAFKEQRAAAEPCDRTSIAAVLRIIRYIMYNESQAPKRGESLAQQLRNAQTDTYDRKSKKKSRNHPRRKEEPSAGPPQVREATEKHKQRLQQLECLQQPA